MKDRVMNIKREDKQGDGLILTIKQRMALLVHRSDMHSLQSRHGSLDKIIKLYFLLIMISPQRTSNVESIDYQSLVLFISL